MSINWGRKWSLQTRILTLIVVISASILGMTEWLSTLSSIRAIEAAVSKQTAHAAARLAVDLRAVGSVNFPVEYQYKIRDILELEPNVIRVDVYAEIDGILQAVQTSSTLGNRPVESRELSAFQRQQADTFIAEEKATTRIVS